MIESYSKRFLCWPKQIARSPKPGLKIVIVIPCFNEPNIEAAIQSIYMASTPTSAFEIIAVINHGENASKHVKLQNEQSASTISNLQQSHDNLHLIKACNLPDKHAGVGWARKIGMDEACRRLQNCLESGVIVCYDADSDCTSNYLTEIEKAFEDPSTRAASIRFEHPIDDLNSNAGIIWYELFLRYHNCGQKYAGLPFAKHTVGSSMAVRPSAYLKQGGMNRRKAGEDFYFLHKFIGHDGFIEINNCMVIPSVRGSDRVPFGTGKAVNDFQKDPNLIKMTYPISTYHELKRLVDAVHNNRVLELDGLMGEFLKSQGVEDKIKEIERQTSTQVAFEKRFYQWFDAFKCLKFVHWYRDQFGTADLLQEAHSLLKLYGVNSPVSDSKEMLILFRELEYSKG